MQPIGPDGRELVRELPAGNPPEPRDKLDLKPTTIFNAFVEAENAVIDLPEDVFERLFYCYH